MSIYLILYLSVIFSSIWVAYTFLKKYNNLSGIFFMVFNISLSWWFFLYFLSFFTTTDVTMLAIYWKWMYFFSILGQYSLLSFIYLFSSKNKPISYRKILLLLSVIFGFVYLYIFTPYIISWVELIPEKNDYYETLWSLVYLHVFLNILFVPLFLYFVIKSYKTLININKIRLKYILVWSFIFLLLWILFQLILPIFGLYLFEKEIVILILPFLFFSWYSVTRYHFSDYTFKYNEIVSFLLSVIITLFLTVLIKNIWFSFWENFINYWWLNTNFTYIDLIFSIIIFYLIYNFLTFILPWNKDYNSLIDNLNRLKEQIPFLDNLDSLNDFLEKKILLLYRIKRTKIILKKGSKNSEIIQFFEKNIMNDLFINDIVFLEENKNKFNLEKIWKEIDKSVYIIFPMRNNMWELVWVIELWWKPLREQYYSEEIKFIKDFVNFLVWHLKYIEIYGKINDLNLNLDKEVDRKTIKYNNLLNKQKEFISVASHEIKTPVMASSLQVESIIDDIESWDMNNNLLKSELNILKDQIFKLSDLVKILFSAQKYDINKVSLYIEKVKLKDLMLWEIESVQKRSKNLVINFDFDENITFIDLDKVQFTQVISNLLNNAFKFLDKNNPRIDVIVKNEWKNITIDIDDNWNWFKFWEWKYIFDKYSTGKWKSIWLGLWLYLCKKIVEYHKWEIKALNSEKLGGANFNLVIPKIQKKDS